MVLASDNVQLCAPDTINFYDNSITGNPNDPITSWNWTFGDGTTSTLENPTHVYSTPGTYSVYLTVSTNGGCTNNSGTTPYIINAYPYPIANFSVNSTFLDLPYDALITTNQSTGATTYNWDFGDGVTSTAVNPQHLYSEVTTYQIQLIATSAFGCTDTAYKEVTTSADIVFPNAFTPDPDGSNGGTYDINDLTNNVFHPFTSGVTDYVLQIFNRWGELIFESKDVKIGWDGYYRGQICQEDVYIWKASVKLNNGKLFQHIGDVTLLR
jgi:gliding motility-associated-like protein